VVEEGFSTPCQEGARPADGVEVRQALPLALKQLAVVSQKGGVGKTTLSLNLAYALAARGRRTLLVDTDPQGAIGHSLARRSGQFRGLANYLEDRRPLGEMSVATRLPELRLLLLGALGASDLEEFVTRVASGDLVARVLQDADGGFDVVVLDTPSGLHGVTAGVMRHVSHVLVPLQAEPLALRSADQVLEMVALLRAQGASVELAGFVLSMVQARNEHSLQVAREIWGSFPPEYVLETTLPRHPSFLAATAAGVPVGLLGKNAPALGGIFDQLAAEIEPRLGLQVVAGDDGPIDLLV
jgi:chromosome partitioning protein